MSLLKSIATVGGYTMASRVLGFARDVLIAAALGTGPVADAFFIAFKLPNFFRRLFAEGAFNAAFVPLFAGRIATEGQAAAKLVAEQILSVLVATLLVFTILFEIAMPAVVYVFAPGFADEPAKFALAVEFSRITFPYLLFISLVSQLGGVLNSLNRFAAAAATPIILNLAIIAAQLALTPVLPTAGHALAWGVMLAGVLQFLWLIEACRREGLSFRLPRPRLTPAVRRLMVLIVPGAIGAGVVQINALIGTMIASLLPTGAVSYLYYADRIYELPLAVIGIAVGTAILPLLTRQIRSGAEAAANANLNRALEFALLLTLPATAALIVIPETIAAVLYERGAFDAAATRATALTLIAYAVGLPAYVLVKVLAPGFFAREDTKTPVKLAAVAVAVNIAVAVGLVFWLSYVGIALGTAVSAWVNAVMLGWVLHRRGHLRLDARLKTRLPRILLATLAMTGVLVAGIYGLPAVMPALGFASRAVLLAILVLAGLLGFGLAALLFRAAEPADVRGMLKRQGGAGSAPISAE
jgi:putative peptidoglycan lipid II flippase